MALFFEQEDMNNIFIKVSGDFELSSVNTFESDLEGDTPGNITFTIGLKGSLNNSAGQGSGTFTIKEQSDSSSTYSITEGNWTLTKVSSN